MKRSWILTLLVALSSLGAVSSRASAPPPSLVSIRDLQAILASPELQSKLAWNDTIQSIQHLTSGYQITTAYGCVMSVSVTHVPGSADPSGSIQLQFFPNERCTQQ